MPDLDDFDADPDFVRVSEPVLPTEDCVGFLLELMNLPPLDDGDYVWFSSDWQGEDRLLSQRFSDLFISRL